MPTKKKLSAKQMRLDIATDVIYQLVERGAYVATPGTYLRSFGGRTIEAMVARWDIEKEDPRECLVCAKGALFCSALGLDYDGSPPARSTVINGDIRDGLKGVFSVEQLDLIEDAFEGFSAEEENLPVLRFYLKYEDATERMVAIMQNILDNDGTFKP